MEVPGKTSVSTNGRIRRRPSEGNRTPRPKGVGSGVDGATTVTDGGSSMLSIEAVSGPRGLIGLIIRISGLSV